MIKKINQAASILGLVLCAVLAYSFWKAGLFDSKEALTSCISRFGWAGPAVFITFQAVQVVIPILPGGLGCLAGSSCSARGKASGTTISASAPGRWRRLPSPAPAAARCWKVFSPPR